MSWHGAEIIEEFVSQSHELGFYFMWDGGPLLGQCGECYNLIFLFIKSLYMVGYKGQKQKQGKN